MSEISGKTWWILAGAVIFLTLGLLHFSAESKGFWEPWEAVLLQGDSERSVEAGEEAQRELRQGWPSAAGDFLLKELRGGPEVAEAGGIGELERRSRIPFLLTALLLLFVTAFWVRYFCGDGTAAAAVILMATAPVFYLGVLFLSGPLIYLASMTVAVMGFFFALYGARRLQPGAAALGGIALALTGLEAGPTALLAAALTFAVLGLSGGMNSRAARGLLGLRGFLFFGIGVLPVAVMAAGMEFESWTALFGRELLGEEAPGAGNFAWWLRQVGFGLFPTAIFLVPALGYLSWKFKTTEDEPLRALLTLLVIWPTASFLAAAPAAHFGQVAYPASMAFLILMAMMLSDGEFWKAMRREPMGYYALALTVLFAVAVMGKNLETYPARLVDFMLGDAAGLEFAEDHDYGPWLGRWKYLAFALLFTSFAGGLSWIRFGWLDLKRGKTFFVRWIRWKLKKGEKPFFGGGEGEISRVEAREAWRGSRGAWPRAARWAEGQPGLAATAVIIAALFMVLNLRVFLPGLDEDFSSRSVVETYLLVAEEGEGVFRFQVGEEEGKSFYLRGVEDLENQRDFNQRFDGEERFFAVIPERRLARLHSSVRQSHQVNLPVLARGGGFLLVSNELKEGEEDLNRISEFVLDEPEEEMIPLVLEIDEEEVRPNFNNLIELAGYRLRHPGGEDSKSFRWGDSVEITLYFRVLRRIPRAQEIFMHIDAPGSRIHGDHEPLEGLYPTNHWARGDLIKDVHVVEIPRFTVPGEYRIMTGFFRGSERLRVRPEGAHDGENRVEAARFEVTPF